MNQSPYLNPLGKKPLLHLRHLLYLCSIIGWLQVACKGQIKSSENQSSQSVDKIAEESLAPPQDSIFNQYKNGQKEGLWKEYDENNQLIAEGQYQNGKANGWMKWYYQGELVASGNMREDKRDGLWTICDVHKPSNCIEARFDLGKKVGIWKVLYDSGKVWKEQNWMNGKMVAQKCWDEKGGSITCP
ncbi:MAG: hypothetical protein AAF985_15425 [Bacteroidota bacterium]